MQFSTKLPPQGRGVSVSLSRSRASSLTPPGTIIDGKVDQKGKKEEGEREGETTPTDMSALDRPSPTRAGELWMVENAKTARLMRRFPYMIRGVPPGATPSDVRNFLAKIGPVRDMYLPVHHLQRTPRYKQILKTV